MRAFEKGRKSRKKRERDAVYSNTVRPQFTSGERYHR